MSSSSTSTTSSSTSLLNSPSEQRLTIQWDRCIENGLVKSGTGLLAAGAASLLLFSKWEILKQ